MRKQLLTGRLFSMILLTAILCIGATNAFGVLHAPGGGAGLALLEFVKTLTFGGALHGTTHFAAVQVEIWETTIEGNLFKNNEFITYSVDASGSVLGGKVVHIPQAGATVDVEESRSSIPATVTQRTDTDVTYELKPLSTDPFYIPNAEEAELSYDKRTSALSEAQMTLNESLADRMLIKWSPTAADNIVFTTGENVNTHLADTTGIRKKMETEDLRRAKLVMDKQKIPAAGRYCLMSADMHYQFTKGLTESQYRDFSQYFDAKTGVAGQMYGFKILTPRPNVVVYNAAGSAVNAYGAANSATDCDGVLCWHENYVERAIGKVSFYANEGDTGAGDPTYYGKIYSFEVRYGGRIRRADSAGIVAIVQATGS